MIKYLISKPDSSVMVVDENLPVTYKLVFDSKDRLVQSVSDDKREKVSAIYIVEPEYNQVRDELFPVEKLEYKGSLDDFRKSDVYSYDGINVYLEDNVTLAFQINKLYFI